MSCTSALLTSSQRVLCQHLPPVPTGAIPNLHYSLPFLAEGPPPVLWGKEATGGHFPFQLPLLPPALTSIQVCIHSSQPNVRGIISCLLSNSSPSWTSLLFNCSLTWSSCSLPPNAPPVFCCCPLLYFKVFILERIDIDFVYVYLCLLSLWSDFSPTPELQSFSPRSLEAS